MATVPLWFFAQQRISTHRQAEPGHRIKSQQLNATATSRTVVVATTQCTSVPLSMTDVADIFRRHLELRVFIFGTKNRHTQIHVLSTTNKTPDIYRSDGLLACQSFIRVFKKVTSYSLSCTDTIKRTQNFDLRILLYSSGCRVPNRVHKVLLLTSSSLAALLHF